MKGFTLVEILVALVILMIGIIAIAGIMTTIVKQHIVTVDLIYTSNNAGNYFNSINSGGYKPEAGSVIIRREIITKNRAACVYEVVYSQLLRGDAKNIFVTHKRGF